jgi:HD-GYP domain-containing protein (c-di-GMP phosphodiesterase class II)
LNQALRIMSFMRDDQHIDAELFDLFLTSGIHQTYAEQHLKPTQIEAVDIGQYLSNAGA